MLNLKLLRFASKMSMSSDVSASYIVTRTLVSGGLSNDRHYSRMQIQRESDQRTAVESSCRLSGREKLGALLHLLFNTGYYSSCPATLWP